VKAFKKETEFEQARTKFYKVQGYMLIRNYNLGLKEIKLIEKLVSKESVVQDVNLMKYYGLKSLRELFLT
jgi:hypothetical protein